MSAKGLELKTEPIGSQDAKINKMTAHQIVKEWCAWKIGDGWWWSTMKSYFDELSKCEQDESRTQLD